MIDVAVIGAGLAGLTCARQLQEAGYSVVVVEKSQGLGGRVATRRFAEARADHGLRYLENQGPRSQQLIETLATHGILQVWTDQIHEYQDSHLALAPDNHPRFVAEPGMTAIAKFLGRDLTIWRSQLVTAIAPQEDQQWSIQLKPIGNEERPPLQAKGIVVAIPAPQALALLTPLVQHGLSADILAGLEAVEFDPCISAIVSFPPEFAAKLDDVSWRSVSFPNDSVLKWVGLDSSKRLNAPAPVIVVHSQPDFAQTWLDATDLAAAGEQMLTRAAQVLLPWLNSPQTMQVHRWRYAFTRVPHPATHMATNLPLPLVCSGDWCGGKTVESALQSGNDAAGTIAHQLRQ
jgi:hypothetical protein